MPQQRSFSLLGGQAQSTGSTLHEWACDQEVSDRLFTIGIRGTPYTEGFSANNSDLHGSTTSQPSIESTSFSSGVIADPSDSLQSHRGRIRCLELNESGSETLFQSAASSMPGLTTSSCASDKESLLQALESSPIQGTVQLMPDGDEVDPLSLPHPVFMCRFWFLGCTYASTDEAEWKQHTLAHLRGHVPPSSNTCPHCDMTFNIPDPHVSWAANMSHLAQHFKTQRVATAASRAEPKLCRFLWAKRIIGDVQYQEIVGGVHRRDNVDGHKAYLVQEKSNRRAWRRDSNVQSRM